MKPGALRRGFAWAVGAMDLATGAGLVAAPAWTLGRMGVAAPGADARVFVGWVGIFVGAVGATYLVALVQGGAARLRHVFFTTSLFRVSVGVYCAAAVASGALDARWITVAATDLAVAGVQVWLLARGGWADE